MGWIAKVLAFAWLAWSSAFATAAGKPDFGQDRPSADARYMAEWVARTADHRGRHFAIVDKKGARIYVFAPDGRLAGSSAVLLGQAVGDDSAPNVGAHTDAGKVPYNERTTPAGRFVSEPGNNLRGEHVVWVDYHSAFAIHRLRQDVLRADRERRLVSTDPQEKRASLGCVVVPEAFYERVVMRALGQGRGVVYVLPETRPVSELVDGS